jgi:predicted TIM-barrel fold metal-dependent hydrolase
MDKYQQLANEPHSPDVKIRETLDGGFSKGLGFHFQPNEKYWLDSHNHLGNIRTHQELYKLLDEWFSRLDAYRLGRMIVIASNQDAFKAYGNVSKFDDRFRWLISIPFNSPDAEVLESAIENETCGIKLHNAPIMRGEGEPNVWLNDDWSKIFSIAEKKGLPILWHVTQRMSGSPYHGGGENSYWEDGYKKGVTFTNEDLLGITLEILKKFPKLRIIGAHQLHVGLERLSVLFEEYENLYIDTSCSFFLRWGDNLYENDRKILREFFTKYQDRILFGTDSPISLGDTDEYKVQAFLCHVRFIKQLRLDDEVLQKISHRNAERLYNLQTLDASRRGTSRP